MRWSLLACLVGVGVGVAGADPRKVEHGKAAGSEQGDIDLNRAAHAELRDVVEQSRVAGATERAAAARRIAARLRAPAADPGDRAAVRTIALTAVLTDDPVVRTTIIDALVDAGLVARPATARIPTLATLDRQLRALVARRGDPKLAVPPATRCQVTDTEPRAATIECHGSRCAGSCIHVTTQVTLRAGVRWEVVHQDSSASDDGACGCCMSVE